MAITRADTYTQTQKKQELFSDFLDSFAVSPVGGALAKVSNELAVKQSVKNLVLTNLGERLFQPNIGTNVTHSLFEPNDVIAALEIKEYIEYVLRYFEPRAKEVTVNVYPSTDKNYLEINIIFYVINNINPTEVSLSLSRVR